MAALISRASSAFTSAATWGLVEPISYLDAENGPTASTTSFVYTATFTPGVVVIDGIALKIGARASSPLGTFSVELYDNTAGATVETVVVNVTDILYYVPTYNHGWYFFKFVGTQTLIAAHAYKIGIKSSTASTVTLYRNATAGNWSRMLRTTTTQAPAANDRLHVMGEFGNSSTNYTVTMDNTATTAFGTYAGATVGNAPQGITINNRGTLSWGTNASTAYYLKWQGVFAVYEGGVINVGSSGGTIPATSSAVLEMSSIAISDTSLIVAHGASCNMYGNIKTPAWTHLTASNGGLCSTVGSAVTALARSQSFIGLTGQITIGVGTYTILSVTDATHLTLTSSPATQTSVHWRHHTGAGVLTVESTGNWAANDVLCVATTSLVRAQCEPVIIATVDSPTQVTLSGTSVYGHYGVAPMQAEVGNLTRNIVIRSVSTTYQGYIQFLAMSSAVWRAVEMKNIGSNNTTFSGFYATTPTSLDIQYCTIHDSAIGSTYGFNLTGATGNYIISNNIVYNIYSAALYTTELTSGSTVCENNLFMLNTTGVLVYLYQANNFNYNAVVGSAGIGVALYDTNTVITSFRGNTVHSGPASVNLSIGSGAAISNSVLTDTVVWCNPSGAGGLIGIAGKTTGLTFDGLLTFWNDFALALGTANHLATFKRWTAIAIPGYGVNSRVVIDQSTFDDITLIDCDFGPTSTSYPFATTTFNNTYGDLGITADTGGYHCYNCRFGTGVVVESRFTTVHSQKNNQTAGDHRTFYSYGTIATDPTIYDVGPLSVRMQPSTIFQTGIPLKTEFDCVVSNGAAVAVSVKTRESILSDGKAYDGSRPTLWAKANPALGFASDVLLDTATSSGSGAFELLTGTTGTVSDDGIVTCFVQAGSGAYTQGWVNVDTMSAVPVTLDTSGFKYWKDGLPVALNAGAGTLASETSATYAM